MPNIIKNIFGHKSHFYPYETELLNKVKSLLNKEAQNLFQRQIDMVNKVQRLSNNKEVNLYRMRFGKPTFDDSIRFPNLIKEAILAKACFIGESGKAVKIKIWLVQGYIFSLTFDRAPKILCATSALKDILPTIKDVKIITDPMNENKSHNKIEIDIPRIEIKDIVAKAYKFLLPTEIQSALDVIDAKLPNDYIDLIYKTNGANGKGFLIYGIKEIREIIFDSRSYYILAEFEGFGIIAVEGESNNGELYLLQYEIENIKPLGISFERALREALRLQQILQNGNNLL
ncbi:MAG: SMI1/KNR4 family protein [Helicobacteraceae bacterium]|jgi:hypothetical protein|nr:SMI1/KNR4 family protein [Helicobacteraceae bacterium]